jgi:hypothetical protein
MYALELVGAIYHWIGAAGYKLILAQSVLSQQKIWIGP